MCEGDCPDCSKILTICFCFKLCCDVTNDASNGKGSMASNDKNDKEPLVGVQPTTPEMSRFKF